MGVDAAAKRWCPLVHLQVGSMVTVANQVNAPQGLEEHLRLLLQSRAGCTPLAHAKSYEAFQEWFSATGKPVPKFRVNRVAVLMRYLMHLKDKGAKRTVLSVTLKSLGWSSAFLGLRRPWPTRDPQLKMVAEGHHMVNNAPSSSGFFYKPCHIAQMARAAHKMPSPMDRLMLALEVATFLGALRT